MKHVYLSPHLDDAVLSCGGAIHRRTMAGEPVQVITIFCGEYRGQDLSSFAWEQHDQWGNWPRIMALRRAEDQAALTLLGAEGQYLDRLDAVYRSAADGAWMYADEETLFGEVNPADPVALEGAQDLADALGRTIPLDGEPVVYAPLGVGHHVDHQIVHTAGRQLLARGYRLAFYEDYPYGEWPGAVESALAVAAAGSWRMERIALDPADVAAKVSALGYYRSQMAVLFRGAEGMPGRVWAFAATRGGDAGLAERIWWPGAV